MTASPSLLDRAKSGLLSKREVDAVAHELATGTSVDQYTAIHVLGLMRATQYESLVARFLDDPGDPMLVRIAIQVLSAYWGLSRSYREQIRQLSSGVSWDADGDVRLAALTAAGELARETDDREIVSQLVDIVSAEGEPHIVRQAAYFALARAAGREWSDLPPASRKLRLDTELDDEVVSWARRRASR